MERLPDQGERLVNVIGLVDPWSGTQHGEAFGNAFPCAKAVLSAQEPIN